MTYSKHFALVDDVSGHFDSAIRGLDSFTVTRYAGLYAVSSAAVLELALKEIVTEFAASRDVVFGNYMAASYSQINGRIKVQSIRDNHIKPFGAKYLEKFNRFVAWCESQALKQRRGSLLSKYSNLLICRHKFAHEGLTTCTYNEVKEGFEAGKVIMKCLDRSLS